jgi:host factor-I protein
LRLAIKARICIKIQKWGKIGLKRSGKPYIVEPLQILAVAGHAAPFPPLGMKSRGSNQPPPGKAGDRHMENKPAQNIQDTFLNTVRKDKTPITVYLVSGVKLTGKIRSFDKYSVLLENNSQEQLIFKHAISTVVSNRGVMHSEFRPSSGPGPVPVTLPTSIGEPR